MKIGKKIKEAFKFIGKVIGALLLVVLCLVLFVIVTFFAGVWKIIVSIKHENRKARDILTGTATYIVEIAASFDQLGNAAFGGFWTWLFISKDWNNYYKFGDKDETISEVLGWNERLDTLNRTGRAFIWLLNKLDKNHCEKALYSAIEKAKEKVKRANQLDWLMQQNPQ